MGKAARVPAIDVMRGFVMALMALDHVRDYFGPTMFDPTNLAVTTPGDLAAIMEALAEGAILSQESRDAIFEILGRQHYLNLVPRYLPYYPHPEELGHPDNGLRIYNKTGGWLGMRADVALVEWPGVRYVAGIVVEDCPDTRFWAENEADRLIGRISRLIFEHFGGDALNGGDG